MSKIIVQFPADCYVRPKVSLDQDGNQVVNPETGEVVKKRGYYRGIVISGKEEFLKHYVDRSGNPVRQPDNGDTVYYSLSAPNVKGRDANGKTVYENMELEAWSSTDNSGVTKRGIKLVAGRNSNEEALEELKKVRESLGNDEAMLDVYKQKVAQVAENAFDTALRNLKNRSNASAPVNAQTPEPEGVKEPNSDEPSF